MKSRFSLLTGVMVAWWVWGVVGLASSHMDAPLITLDPAANTADVYAFRSSEGGTEYLTTALTVYPFQEPGIGPNKYNFDGNVLYEIHVALADELVAAVPTLSYQFQFTDNFKNTGTILQSYLGVIENVDDASQNLTQTYTVNVLDHRTDNTTDLGGGQTLLVPPNNQGIATPKYNQQDNGNNPAKPGVSSAAELDPYTAQTIFNLDSGHRVFAGQRDDGFYADIQSVFDLLSLRSPGRDSQAGFNVHTIVLSIPLDELGGNSQVVGVYATTSRRSVRVLPEGGGSPDISGDFVQVGRQGNPLFCEALIGIQDKDTYNRSSPDQDAALFGQYALNPEIAGLINLLLFGGETMAKETDRTDLQDIFIPDMLRVDLSTSAVRLAGPPDDSGFSRLSIFGVDVQPSTVPSGLQILPGLVPGGFPNGRRFGDDVVDIAITSLLSDLTGSPPLIADPTGDSVDSNDIAYNKVFPYAATPLNGRTSLHQQSFSAPPTLYFAHFGDGGGHNLGYRPQQPFRHQNGFGTDQLFPW